MDSQLYYQSETLEDALVFSNQMCQQESSVRIMDCYMTGKGPMLFQGLQVKVC